MPPITFTIIVITSSFISYNESTYWRLTFLIARGGKLGTSCGG